MATHHKQALLLARRLFKLSFADGVLSPELVNGVLEYVAKHAPANPVMVLKAYHRLVATELSRSRALVEHAGSVEASVLRSIAAAMTKKYGRPITAESRPNPALIAGLRVRVGDDVYESSVAAQLATLAAGV
ncbi:MAG: F0F1 ATP synthase subunit delta [Opitutae bacterium]|nr:F0F1 ATP synthase subunit delta [Opitutae bacterium]